MVLSDRWCRVALLPCRSPSGGPWRRRILRWSGEARRGSRRRVSGCRPGKAPRRLRSWWRVGPPARWRALSGLRCRSHRRFYGGRKRGRRRWWRWPLTRRWRYRAPQCIAANGTCYSRGRRRRSRGSQSEVGVGPFRGYSEKTVQTGFEGCLSSVWRVVLGLGWALMGVNRRWWIIVAIFAVLVVVYRSVPTSNRNAGELRYWTG